jgi:DNA-directed RNA polymerase specialized sigma24 family protein
MGYVADQKSQISSEIDLIMPRLKSFAAALTGSEAKSQALLKAARNQILARISKERGHIPLALWAFMQTYKVWASRMADNAARQPEAADARLFLPRSRLDDGGASARFAAQLAQLSPQQRGALHLVYGERLSYDETAEIFDVPVSMIIARLAKSYALLARQEERVRPAQPAPMRNSRNEAQEQEQERAA